MSLIKCPECGREVSDKSTACPGCGCPINKQDYIVVKKDYKSKAKAFTIAGIAVLVLTMIAAIANAGNMTGLKAQYLSGNGGMYVVYSFLEKIFNIVGCVLIIIGIIYWIIYAANRNK